MVGQSSRMEREGKVIVQLYMVVEILIIHINNEDGRVLMIQIGEVNEHSRWLTTRSLK